jgi:hypothetical protein
MPPRHHYWTIILEGKPTAFRAHTQDELIPTLRQLQVRHPDAVMKWFARGRLWESQDQERAETFAKRRPGPFDRPPSQDQRPRDWRPGGEHKDPRDRFKVPRAEKRRRFVENLFRERPEASPTPSEKDTGEVRPPRPEIPPKPDRPPRQDRGGKPPWTRDRDKGRDPERRPESRPFSPSSNRPAGTGGPRPGNRPPGRPPGESGWHKDRLTGRPFGKPPARRPPFGKPPGGRPPFGKPPAGRPPSGRPPASRVPFRPPGPPRDIGGGGPSDRRPGEGRPSGGGRPGGTGRPGGSGRPGAGGTGRPGSGGPRGTGTGRPPFRPRPPAGRKPGGGGKGGGGHGR